MSPRRSTRRAPAFEDPRWRDLSQTRRGHLLRRLGDLIGEHAEELARSESQDNGKLLREMRGQLKTLPEYYYYYAGLADKIHGRRRSHLRPQGAELHLTRAARRGRGDHPVELAPDPDDEQAGPRPVRRQYRGDQAVGVHLGDHPPGRRAGHRGRLPAGGGQHRDRVRRRGRAGRWSITPPWPRSRSPAARPRVRVSRPPAAGRFIGCTLELGGKSPNIVFEDANVANAAMGVVAGIFAAAGQTCIAGSRVFAHRAVYDELLERVTERARSIRIGDPSRRSPSLARWRSRTSATRWRPMSTSAAPKGPGC